MTGTQFSIERGEERCLAVELQETRSALARELAERKRVERAFVQAADHERHRLAQMLHDSLCQSLAGVGLLARVVLRRLESTGRGEAGEVAELGEAVACALNEVHCLVQWLRPFETDEQDLAPALSDLANFISQRIPCTFECPGMIVLGDRFAAGQLVQIAHQAVNDALRRAGVSRIAVSLSTGDEGVTLTVLDDGDSAVEESANGSFAGLELMRLRASAMGATLTHSTRPRRGTTITCTIPQAQ